MIDHHVRLDESHLMISHMKFGTSHTEGLWYNESLSVDDNIYAPHPEVEHSGKGINGCHPHNAKLF